MKLAALIVVCLALESADHAAAVESGAGSDYDYSGDDGGSGGGDIASPCERLNKPLLPFCFEVDNITVTEGEGVVPLVLVPNDFNFDLFMQVSISIEPMESGATAVSGEDFNLLNIVSSADSSQSFRVADLEIVDDTQTEDPVETFHLSVQAAYTRIEGETTVSSFTTLQVFIRDNEARSPVLSVESTSATAVSLSWSVPSSSVVEGYEVEWRRDTSGECPEEDEGSASITDGSTTSYDIEGLEEDSRYNITVTASNGAGSSAASNTVTAQTDEAAPSSAPVVVVNDRSYSTVSLQWEPVICIHRNGEITGYTVWYVEEDSSEITIVDVTGATSVNLDGLSSSTRYSVQVAAVNSAGIGVYSDPVIFQTPAPITVGFTEPVYTAVEGSGPLRVEVVVELPQPMPGHTLRPAVQAFDLTAINEVDYFLQQLAPVISTNGEDTEYIRAVVNIHVADNSTFDGERSLVLGVYVESTTFDSDDISIGSNAIVTIEDDDCASGEVRLVGGGRSEEGRVEVCVEGVWSTLCDSQWDYREASVVCQQLNLPHEGAVAYRGSRFGSEPEILQFSSFQCSGGEDLLVDCQTSQPPSTCSENTTAGVYCFSGVPSTACSRNQSCTVAGETSEDGSTIEVSGGVITCSSAYGPEDISLDSTEIDPSFEAVFMSPGSLLLLQQLHVISRGEGTEPCSVSTQLQPYGDPTIVLEKLGVEALSLIYLESEGHFSSLTLSLPELQSLVVSDDYSVQGSLNEETSRSLHWLLYQLTVRPRLPATSCRLPPQSGSTVISFSLPCN